MSLHRRFASLLALSLGICALTTVVPAQQQGDPAPGLTREQMWFAPTKEDWAKPCLITFQRTFEDALRVSKETGKPIMICVNMDGEIASEHYAGIRYRQPDIAALYEPYVAVIASVYRHNPRDFDEQGQRILCPRFGSVTCGEHIAIEPGLYEEFFDGRRIAPRHIGVELNRQEMYDVLLAFDTDTIFNALRDGIANRPPTRRLSGGGDRPLVERVGSSDIEDRKSVETAYLQGDRTVRRQLLEAAFTYRDIDQLDLLRLAIFGFDVELARLARKSLAQCTTEGAIDLIADALRVPMDPGEREALLAALDRLGETWPRARTLAVVLRGLESDSQAVDVSGWSAALDRTDSPAVPTELHALESRLDYMAGATRARPDDASARLELAEAFLAHAVDPATHRVLGANAQTAPKYSQLMFEDARRTGLEAQSMGANDWRVDAVIALSDYYLGNADAAYARAETAVQKLPSGAPEWNAMAVLAVFAESRQRAIGKAARAGEEWPPQWLTDVHAAYSVLAEHPFGTAELFVAHHDFMRRLGANGQAVRILDQGLARFPESWILHHRLRGRILREKGVEGLETVYDAMLRAEDAAPNLPWYAGYASLVAAEFHRRAADDGKALAAYDRAVAHYEAGIAANPHSRSSADHYVALAFAGQARLAFERQDDEEALARILASFRRRPEAAASLDGLNISPVDTARMLMARLKTHDDPQYAERLQAALDTLDPELLGLPAYENIGAGGNPPDRTGRRGRRGRQGG